MTWEWELLGVVGPPLLAVAVVAVVLDERAVRGVGALISDFLGVSGTCLPLVLRLEEEEVDFAAGTCGLLRRPEVMKGWRMAV